MFSVKYFLHLYYKIFLANLLMHIFSLYFAYVKKRRKSDLKDCLNLMPKNDLFHCKGGVSTVSFACYRHGQLVER